MSTNNQSTKTTRKLAIGIDLGTGFAAVDIFEGGRFQPVESPLDGSQIEMVVYYDAKSESFHIGKDAILRSYDDEGDNLFHHAKRNIPNHAEDVLYGGRFTPVQVLTEVLRYLKKLLLAARPELQGYPQFGGSKHRADELAIIFTVPANWSIEQQAYYEAAITDAGFESFDGFIAEPIAAARRLAHVNTTHLEDGDKILVCDVGAGTTDIAALEYQHGVFHQIAAASGDGYLAGLDFTNSIAERIASEKEISWDDVYSEGGLNLSKIPSKSRRSVIACWQAAEEAKKHLSLLDEAKVSVEFPEGRKTVSVSRKQAAELWKGLVERFKECVSKALDGTDIEFSAIDHPMLVGGSSRVPGLREAMAEAMGRDASEILVCTDSERIVSSGAAEHAYYQDDASQALECGLGLTVFDREAERYRNILLVAPGQVLPAEGFFVERSGFGVGIVNGSATLACKPFVCRNGVREVVVRGRETFLEDTEIIRLQEIQSSLDDFPQGEHAVAIGVKADPTRRIWLLCRPTGLGEVDTISIPLVLEEDSGNSSRTFRFLEVVLVLDCSKSMSKYGKLEMLKRGAMHFAEVAVENHYAKVGIVAFPKSTKQTENDKARIACGITDDMGALVQPIESLNAAGGTPLHSALDLAVESFPDRSEGTQRVVVVFTDGMPSDPDKAQAAAEAAKKTVRLITVGIGEDVVEPLLRSMASSPEDYFYAQGAEAIFQSFVGVTDLLWRDGSEEIAKAG